MKKISFLLAIFIGILFMISAEARIDGKVRSHVNKIPRDYEDSIDTLVPYLIKPYDNDYDKAAAIATWIASRVVYDQFLYNRGRPTEIFEKQLKNSNEENTATAEEQKDILISRVGTCKDYAALFVRMCQAAGIQAGTVGGYIVRNKNRPKASMTVNNSHVWNYFMYQGRKVYVDTTWMAGGKLPYSTRISEERREKQIGKFEKLNKKRSKIYPVNDYYFDFDYDKERHDFHYEVR